MKKSLFVGLTAVVISLGFVGCGGVTVPKPTFKNGVTLDQDGKILGYAVVKLKTDKVISISPRFKKYGKDYESFRVTENGYFPKNDFRCQAGNFYYDLDPKLCNTMQKKLYEASAEELNKSGLINKFAFVKKILKSRETLSLVDNEFSKMNISNYKSLIKAQKIRLAKEAKAQKIRLAKEAKAQKIRLAKEAKAQKIRLAKEAKAQKIRLAKEERDNNDLNYLAGISAISYCNAKWTMAFWQDNENGKVCQNLGKNKWIRSCIYAYSKIKNPSNNQITKIAKKQWKLK